MDNSSPRGCYGKELSTRIAGAKVWISVQSNLALFHFRWRCMRSTTAATTTLQLLLSKNYIDPDRHYFDKGFLIREFTAIFRIDKVFESIEIMTIFSSQASNCSTWVLPKTLLGCGWSTTQPSNLLTLYWLQYRHDKQSIYSLAKSTICIRRPELLYV